MEISIKNIFARSYIISIICALGFAAIATLIGVHKIAWFDDRIITVVQGQESAGLTAFMKFFTFIGEGIPVAIITVVAMVILYFGLKFRSELIFFVGVVVGSALLNTGLKLIFQRARPTLHRIVEANGFSFPSGHSMAAFSLYGVLCFLLWKHMRSAFARVVLIIAGCLITVTIGISRIYVGVHYPSDVIGGFLASAAWLVASIAYYQYWIERRNRKQSDAQ
ncbi:phosphatase PAP2 family protein [Cohnella abietis]|uniref:Phosphatase PAP2 family protein n=1 Tax=Cohnella abietis TaxID=2507935 RepID=A0A3T1D2T5_9BACL|nr:phosphatase PAP2 family protein [Cohnella abietis]BBI32416.1 phosphatase PAP2 family protein [Cohnella abietis]